MNYLTINNLSIGYTHPLISGINFSIDSGDLIKLSGTNGSGKTTFIKTLLGIVKPIDGDINYSIDRKDISYVPQENNIPRTFPSTVNEIVLSDSELINTALEAENLYVGVSCGKLDQSCEVLCKKDNLLYLDTKDDSFSYIPTLPEMKPYKIAIFFSGLERSLAGSAFNMRVDECRSAAYALKAFAGMPYGKFNQTNLRDVPREIYESYKDKLPDNWRKRAEHWYTEFARVEAGAAAWEKGDIEMFGKLCFESGKSSIYNYETGSPELKTLYEIRTRTDGIYGGRFSGAGFKGCCMALIDPAFEQSIFQKVETEYLKVFPALKGKYSSYSCYSADGVKCKK